MKVFVTGVHGLLEYDVMNELTKRNIMAIGSDIASSDNYYKQYYQMDITDVNSVNNVLEEVMPDVVIHCAAWTAVDAAEDDENRNKVYLVNAVGTKNIANACKKIKMSIANKQVDVILLMTVNGGWFTTVVFRDGVPEMVATS